MSNQTVQEMDGSAIKHALKASPGPDCLKPILLAYGARVKVYSALKSFLEASTSQSDVG